MEIYSWNYINVFLKLNIQRTILEVWSVYRYVETNLKTKGKKVEQHLEKTLPPVFFDKIILNCYILRNNTSTERKEQVMRIEHSILRHSYLFVLEESDPPTCDLCNTSLNIFHVVNECLN